MRSLPLALAVTTALVAGPSNAASPGESERPGRYTMQPADGGFLRLDTATGDVSLCQKAGAAFECKPVKDDRDLQAEVARLADENKGLKAEIKRLEGLLGPGGKVAPEKKIELPTEEDVDKALSYLERIFKKVRDKLKDLESAAPPPPPPPPPGKEGPPAKGTPL